MSGFKNVQVIKKKNSIRIKSDKAKLNLTGYTDVSL